jgi:hypothetical protein
MYFPQSNMSRYSYKIMFNESLPKYLKYSTIDRKGYLATTTRVTDAPTSSNLAKKG